MKTTTKRGKSLQRTVLLRWWWATEGPSSSFANARRHGELHWKTYVVRVNGNHYQLPEKPGKRLLGRKVEVVDSPGLAGVYVRDGRKLVAATYVP
jgi:hypothetical protein